MKYISYDPKGIGSQKVAASGCGTETHFIQAMRKSGAKRTAIINRLCKDDEEKYWR